MKNLYKNLRYIRAMTAGARALAEQENWEKAERLELVADLAEAIETGLEEVLCDVGERIEADETKEAA